MPACGRSSARRSSVSRRRGCSSSSTTSRATRSFCRGVRTRASRRAPPRKIVATIGVRQGALHGEFTTRNSSRARSQRAHAAGERAVPHARGTVAPDPGRGGRLPRGSHRALCVQERPHGTAVRVEVRRTPSARSWTPSSHGRARSHETTAGADRPGRLPRKHCVVVYATRERQYLWHVELPAGRPSRRHSPRRAQLPPRTRGRIAGVGYGPVGVFGEPRSRDRALRRRRPDRALPAAAARSARSGAASRCGASATAAPPEARLDASGTSDRRCSARAPAGRFPARCRARNSPPCRP